MTIERSIDAKWWVVVMLFIFEKFGWVESEN